MISDPALSINLVLHDFCRGWVIEKIADQLCGALRDQGVETAVNARPAADATVNHFMIFHYAEPAPGTLNTMAVTHVDDVLKVKMIRDHLKSGVRAAICMSSMTANQLADAGIPRDRLTYALPAYDGAVQPRRIVIGITSNNYSDGRKRAWLLTRLAQDLRLDDFEFQIFGRGWDEVSEQLIGAGATVVLTAPSEDYIADYAAIKAAVPNFDYYFYPGLDEGSLGALDALAADVKTIITNQGYHLDLPGAITHGFWDYEELRKIFADIISSRQRRLEIARSLTWKRYAQRHLRIWQGLLEGDAVPGPDILDDGGVGGRDDHSGVRGRPANKRSYPVEGYFRLMRDRYRRQMALRFLWPEAYQNYLDTRRTIGRLLRGPKGPAR